MAITRSAPPVLSASPAPEARPAPGTRPVRDPVDHAVDACTRFAAHLVLLSHQLGEHGLDFAERERLAAALAIAERALNVAAAAGTSTPGLPGRVPNGTVGCAGGPTSVGGAR